MSYWGETSDLLRHLDYESLTKRFGKNENIINYFGDLTGEKIYERWVEEYRLARNAQLESVTFHLIDYFHIDGLWKFRNKRGDIVIAHARILNELLKKLKENQLLENGPIIEIENAGFCLEYGVQTAQDFEIVFSNINDEYEKVRVAWDINHLFHAIGMDTTGHAKFMLSDLEITSEMKELESTYGSTPQIFVEKWLELNLLYPPLLAKVRTLHISDCILRTEIIFKNGQLTTDYLEKITKLQTEQAKEEFGANLVKTYFDSHIPVGPNALSIISVVRSILKANPNINLYHEFKDGKKLAEFQGQLEVLGI